MKASSCRRAKKGCWTWRSTSCANGLTNGALTAMVVIDAVTRLLPGVLCDDNSSRDESFSHGLLEYPQYTRPAEFRGMKVPDVLVSGNHAEIEKWRREQAEKRTKERRPDLLK